MSDSAKSALLEAIQKGNSDIVYLSTKGCDFPTLKSGLIAAIKTGNQRIISVLADACNAGDVIEVCLSVEFQEHMFPGTHSPNTLHTLKAAVDDHFD